jgi:hypothetical protein
MSCGEFLLFGGYGHLLSNYKYVDFPVRQMAIRVNLSKIFFKKIIQPQRIRQLADRGNAEFFYGNKIFLFD